MTASFIPKNYVSIHTYWTHILLHTNVPLSSVGPAGTYMEAKHTEKAAVVQSSVAVFSYYDFALMSDSSDSHKETAESRTLLMARQLKSK